MHVSSRAVGLAFCLAAVACRDSSLPTAPRTQIQSVVADTNSDGAILLHVELSAPSTVNVDYWTDPAHKLRLQVAESGVTGTIWLPSLAASKRYQYEVSAVGLAGASGPTVSGHIDTPPLPDNLQQVQINTTGTSSAPLTMLEFNGPYRGFVAVNSAGEPVWRWATQGTPQGFTRRANGNFVFLDAGYGLFEVTPDGRTVHELHPLPNGDRAPHHDVIATPANTLLFIALEQRAVTSPLGGSSVAGEAIWEWSPESGALTQRWSAFDFYDPAVDVGARSTSSDWLHANSLALGDHGNVILSLNWLSQVVSIAPDWHSLEWRMGGANSTVALDSAAVFQGQHTVSLLPNGHLLVFDNGRDRTAGARHSRALEIAFDPHGTGRLAWSFRPTPDEYDPYVGSARRLSNGNTLIWFGMHDGFAGAVGPMGAYEARADGSVAWRLTLDAAGNINYRATPLASIAGETAVP